MDWIKVQKCTPDKTEIAILARKLGVDQGTAFLQWFRVYAWADDVTATGSVPNLSLSDGDTLSRSLPGTCAALASPEIGWPLEDGGQVLFVNWERHNGRSAKQRAYEAEKQRRQREMSRSCPENVPLATGTKVGPEKRREEKNKESPNKAPLRFVPPSLEEVTAYCAERGGKVDPQAWYDHYTANGWMVGRHRMKDWRAAVRTWERNGATHQPKRYGVVTSATPRKSVIAEFMKQEETKRAQSQ